jgi:hypothetical protein
MMQTVMQKHFTERVCFELLGSDPCWWKNYTGCCNNNMHHFYNTVGGYYKDRLTAWGIAMMEKELEAKAVKEQATLAQAETVEETVAPMEEEGK